MKEKDFNPPYPSQFDPPDCETCKHYLGDAKCKAFPQEIPIEIIVGKDRHRESIPGDNGIIYTPKAKSAGED